MCGSGLVENIELRQSSLSVPGEPGFSLCLGPVEARLSTLHPQAKDLEKGATCHTGMFYVCGGELTLF